MLLDMGRAQTEDATGVYDPTTASQVRQLQRDTNVPVTGVVDADTWHAVQIQACPLYDLPSTKASP
jgi:peptidoglycan hydrolase-like protein with peptidoglycan-binding domain